MTRQVGCKIDSLLQYSRATQLTHSDFSFCVSTSLGFVVRVNRHTVVKPSVIINSLLTFASLLSHLVPRLNRLVDLHGCELLQQAGPVGIRRISKFG
jgi:hypothetical protein